MMNVKGEALKKVCKKSANRGKIETISQKADF